MVDPARWTIDKRGLRILPWAIDLQPASKFIFENTITTDYLDGETETAEIIRLLSTQNTDPIPKLHMWHSDTPPPQGGGSARTSSCRSTSEKLAYSSILNTVIPRTEATFIHHYFNPATCGNSLSELRHARHPSMSAQFICATCGNKWNSLSACGIDLCQLNLCAPRVEQTKQSPPWNPSVSTQFEFMCATCGNKWKRYLHTRHPPTTAHFF